MRLRDTNLVCGSLRTVPKFSCYIGADKERLASVFFTVYTPDTYIPARVDLVYEDGAWKIDNFYHLKYAMNLKECMWEFLQNDQSEFI